MWGFFSSSKKSDLTNPRIEDINIGFYKKKYICCFNLLLCIMLVKNNYLCLSIFPVNFFAIITHALIIQIYIFFT